MLDQITIENFATIEKMTFDLGDGLNIITGETGTGKSVLIQAISTALGDRADISMVRTGANKAVIQIAGTLDGREVVISRELLSSGKSVSKLNGELVTLAQLREFCRGFADIHGQYDNQLLLDPENHIGILDAMLGSSIAPELYALSELHDRWSELNREYRQVLAGEAEARRQLDFYRFEHKYISELGLREGEDDELKEQLEVMRNSSKIYGAVNRAYERLHEAEPSIISSAGSCMSELESVASYSEGLSDIAASFTDIYYSLEDLSDRLRELTGSLTFSEEDMDRASERLSVIEEAKRKYSSDIAGILKYGDEISQKLELFENFDEAKEDYAERIAAAHSEMEVLAERIHGMRVECASELERMMSLELTDLDFANNGFAVDFSRTDEIGSAGFDSVEFTVSTNPGEPLRSLTKVASGGEISRIMLAFKHLLGDSDRTDTMIFDEIDTGISGRTALTVGKKLKEISEHHQILCITHLPQIAACGDDNYLISKDLVDGRSSTVIEHLDEDGKVSAIANLMSGKASSESAVRAARELLES